MAVLQGGASRRLGARGAEVAARGALALTPASFLSVAFAAVPNPPLFAPIYWLWLGLVLFALCKCEVITLMNSSFCFAITQCAKSRVMAINLI